MNKFKIGDKVVPAVDSSLDCHSFLTSGAVYTVVNTSMCGVHQLIDVEGVAPASPSGRWNLDWSEDWFELYEEKEKEVNVEQMRDDVVRIDKRIEEANKDIESAQEEREALVEKIREKGFSLIGDKPEVEVRTCTVDNVKVGDVLILVSPSWNCDVPVGSEVIVLANDESDVPLKVETRCGDYEDWTEIDSVKFKQ